MAHDLGKLDEKESVKKRHVSKKSCQPVADNSCKNDKKQQENPRQGSWMNVVRSSIKYIVLVLFIPCLLNYAALMREEREFNLNGFLNKTLDGEKLFVHCKGKGKPTVFMDAPTGINSDIWIHIFNEAAKISKACVYDRAGIGFSDRPRHFNPGNNSSSGTPHTTERMVDDMRYLFSNSSEVERPFLFVGAELGAINARFYAQMYPDDVSSLVLINPIFEGIFGLEGGKWEKFWLGPFLTSLQRLRILAVCGLSRLGLRFGALKEIVSHEGLPDEIKIRQKHLMCKPNHLYSAVEEHYFLNESLAQLRLLHRIRPLSKTIPVSLITSSKFSDSAPNDINRIWKEAQSLNRRTLLQTPTEIKSGTSANKLILSEHQLISKQIRKQIENWRENSKKSSKY